MSENATATKRDAAPTAIPTIKAKAVRTATSKMANAINP